MDSSQKTPERTSPQSLLDWQIDEIKKGIAEADRGEFASDEEVEEVLKRWGISRAQKTSRHP